MKEEELKNMALLALDESVNYNEANITDSQEDALDYYLGLAPEGNDIQDRSQVISRDVADTIEWMLPDVIRPFVATDDYVKFNAQSEEDEEGAEQETDYVNHVLRNDNNAFLLFYTWFKDAMLFKNGFVKAWWQDEETPEEHDYKGLTDEDFLKLATDDFKDFEVRDHEEYPDQAPKTIEPPPKPPQLEGPPGPGPRQGPPGLLGQPPPQQQPQPQMQPPGAAPIPGQPPPMPGVPPEMQAAPPMPAQPPVMPDMAMQPMGQGAGAGQGLKQPAGPMEPLTLMAPAMLHDCTFVRVKRKEQVKIEVTPRNETYVSKYATSYLLEDCPFVAHVRKRTISELREMGYPKSKVNKIRGGDIAIPVKGDIHHVFSLNEDEKWDDLSAIDESRRKVWLAEIYIMADYDGDGRSEIRTLHIAGDQVLENDKVSRHPFHSITPTPITHQWAGLSIYDLVKDIQDIRTTIHRQILDNLYFINNKRVIINDDTMNLDDMLTVRPNAVVRNAGPVDGCAMPLTTESVIGDCLPMLEILDNQRTDRTGVSKEMRNLDPNVLKDVNSAPYLDASQAMKARIEMVTRIFAEGVRGLMLHVHELLCKHQKKERVVKLRNQYIPVNPAEWKTRTDMTINVGLGTGNKEQTAVNLQQIIAAQEKIVPFGLIDARTAFNTFEKLVNNAGYRDVTSFCLPPEQAKPPKPEGADPALEMLKLQAEADQRKNEIEAEKLQLEHSRDLFDLERKNYETEQKYEQQLQDMKAKYLLQDKEGEQKASIEAEKLAQGWEKLEQTRQDMMQKFELEMAKLQQQAQQSMQNAALQQEGMVRQDFQKSQDTELKREGMARQDMSKQADREQTAQLSEVQLKAKENDKPTNEAQKGQPKR